MRVNPRRVLPRTATLSRGPSRASAGLAPFVENLKLVEYEEEPCVKERGARVVRVLSLLFAVSLYLFSEPALAADVSFEPGTGVLPTIIVVEGEIQPGDDKKFRQISLKLPKATVILNSEGGSLSPALEIGRLIRVAGYETIVLDGQTCASACALIWLAGYPREIIGQGQVGFHAAYRDNQGKLEEVGAANALIGSYLNSMGLPTRAVLFATTAPPDRILWLSDPEGRLSGIDYNHYPNNPSEPSENVQENSERLLWQEQSSEQLQSIRTRNLISSLSRSGEKWTKIPQFRNAYYDQNSLTINRGRRNLWILFDFSSRDEGKITYELNQVEVDCKKGLYRSKRTVNNINDFPRNYKFSEPAPGSNEKAMLVRICSL